MWTNSPHIQDFPTNIRILWSSSSNWNNSTSNNNSNHQPSSQPTNGKKIAKSIRVLTNEVVNFCMRLNKLYVYLSVNSVQKVVHSWVVRCYGYAASIEQNRKQTEEIYWERANREHWAFETQSSIAFILGCWTIQNTKKYNNLTREIEKEGQVKETERRRKYIGQKSWFSASLFIQLE